LPGAAPATGSAPGGAVDGASVESFLQGLDLNKEPGGTPDRYGTDKAPPAAEQSPPSGVAPAATEPAPANEKNEAEQPKK
jgi:hypothetical protein